MCHCACQCSIPHLPRGVSFIKVEPSLHAHHGAARDVAKDKVAFVTFNYMGNRGAMTMSPRSLAGIYYVNYNNLKLYMTSFVVETTNGVCIQCKKSDESTLTHNTKLAQALLQ